MNSKEREKEALRIKRNKRIVISVIAAILALVIIAGAVIGGIALIRNIRAVVRFEGITLDLGMTSYLAATFKTQFMAEHKITADDGTVWASPSGVGDMTWAEVLESEFESFIRGVVIGAYLFDRYYSLSAAEKLAIEGACEEILDFKAGGDRKKFNNSTEDMGFDYRDMCNAIELLYKAERAKAVIYGVDGQALEKDQGRLEECSEYYKQYVRVKILYIPTRVDLVKDDNGKLTMDKDGMYVTRSFTEAELASRLEEIQEIRDLIDARDTGGHVQITEEYFDYLQEKFNYSKTYVSTGYYFSPTSEYRQNFAKDSSARLSGDYKAAFYKNREWVIETAFLMAEGEYREYEDEYGVTFIYKCEREASAYTYMSLEDMFHDFYSDAADYLYAAMRDILIDQVEIRDKFSRIDIVSIPYNYVYVPKIGL